MIKPRSAHVSLVFLSLIISCGDDVSTSVPLGDAASERDGSSVAQEAGAEDAAAVVDASSTEDAGAEVDASAGETWATFAQGFFATYCSECHSAAPRNYTTITDIQRDAISIRCGVSDVRLDGCAPSPSPRLFPVGPGARPSDEERQRLVAWIADGLQE